MSLILGRDGGALKNEGRGVVDRGADRGWVGKGFTGRSREGGLEEAGTLKVEPCRYTYEVDIARPSLARKPVL